MGQNLKLNHGTVMVDMEVTEDGGVASVVMLVPMLWQNPKQSLTIMHTIPITLDTIILANDLLKLSQSHIDMEVTEDTMEDGEDAALLKLSQIHIDMEDTEDTTEDGEARKTMKCKMELL